MFVGVFPYIHCRVDLSYGLIIQWELVDLDPVADQLTHDFDLELVQLALTDGVRFRNHWDDVHLQQDIIHLYVHVQKNRLLLPQQSVININSITGKFQK